MFFKYRTKWSHGPSEWKIIESESNKSLREEFKNSNDYDYSEHFRGYEWVALKGVPSEYINKLIKRNLDIIKFAKKEIDRLKKIKTLDAKPSCSNCSHGPRKDCSYYRRRKMDELDKIYKCFKMNKWKSMW